MKIILKRELPAICPSCSERLKVEKLKCDNCMSEVQGQFPISRLARLDADDQRFIELLMLAEGSLKEVGAQLQLSYPTVRKRLNEVNERLKKEIQYDQRKR